MAVTKSEAEKNAKIRSVSCSHFIFASVLSLSMTVLTASAAYAYDNVTIKNNTEYTINGDVEYVSAFCSDDEFTVAPNSSWTADSRGVCLVAGITGYTSEAAKHNESTRIKNYTSSGTSYSKFQINAYEGAYRVFSEAEYGEETQAEGKSPGFKFVNHTDYPVAYRIGSVTQCAYHGVLPASKNGDPGIKAIDTGSVWFNLAVKTQTDKKNPYKSAMKEVCIGLTRKGDAVVGGPRLGSLIPDPSTDGYAALSAQFAGYAWPFQCNQMPQYSITGDLDNFTLEKVNTCGDDMMLASSKKNTQSNETASKVEEYIFEELEEDVRLVEPAGDLPVSGLVTADRFYWFINGDGTRNWLESAPRCASRAKRINRADIDAMPKRHNGTGGYTLKPESFGQICSNASTGVTTQILTNGSYYWLINADGTRNWINSMPANCKDKAIPVSDIDNYPKRHKGSNAAGYKLNSADVAMACKS